MQKIDLEVRPRDLGEKGSKKNPNQLRKMGYIPAVLYGHGNPVAVAVEAKNFNKLIHGGSGMSALFTVQFGAKKDLTIIKEIQRDIFTQQPIHLDFQRIDLKERLEVTVPIHLIGEAPGVKVSHGILQHIQRDVRIKCLPSDIPASIDIDITKLELHHSIKVEDVTPPTGVEILTPKDHVVVTVVAPKVEEEAPKPVVEGEAGLAAQPEVIAKGKKEEEGAATAPAAASAADQGEKKKAK